MLIVPGELRSNPTNERLDAATLFFYANSVSLLLASFTGGEKMTAAYGKPYKGIAMEGVIAKWYAQNTRRDHRRFRLVADTLAERTVLGSSVLEVAPGPGYLAIETRKIGPVCDHSRHQQILRADRATKRERCGR